MNTRVLGEGKYLRLVDDRGWEYVHRHGANGVVVIVAITSQGRLILVEQFRTAVNRRVVELPAGLVGDGDTGSDESLTSAAHRELREETGYDAAGLVRLADAPTAVGFSSEMLTFFQANGLTRVGPGGGDASEDITVHEVSLQDLRPWLAGKQTDGCLVDHKIFAGIYLAGGRA